MLVLFLMVSAIPVRACLMLELFLMVSLYLTSDMLPHNGDHCGEGLSDVGAVSDGDLYT